MYWFRGALSEFVSATQLSHLTGGKQHEIDALQSIEQSYELQIVGRYIWFYIVQIIRSSDESLDKWGEFKNTTRVN